MQQLGAPSHDDDASPAMLPMDSD